MEPSDIKSETSLTSQETIPISVTCIKKQPAINLCFNQDCDKYAFVCASTDCQCNQEHSLCSLTVIKNLAHVLKKKTVSLKPIESTISKEFDKLIDKVSEIRDILISECHQEFAKFYGLQTYESQFMIALQKQDVKDIRGKDIFKIEMNIKTLTKKAIGFKNSHERIKNSIKKLDEELDRVNKEIQRQIDILTGKKVIFLDSSVVKIAEQENIIEGFFQGRKIKEARKLYRATEDNFQVNKFHEKCDGKNNIFVICETEFGKKLGGYTPLAWNSSGAWANDNSYQSFLFSVSKNVRFNQANATNNLYFGAGNGPYFGGSQDFHIVNQGNTSNCRAAFTSAFTNPSYAGNSQNTNMEILGGPACTFKVTEWEVFQLQFN